MVLKAINLCIPEWCDETEARVFVGLAARVKGTALEPGIRLEVSEQYLQVLLSHYKEARRGLESLERSLKV